LGLMYHRGIGTEINHLEAVKWFRAAAIQGDAGAQFNLGVKYARGEGVPADYIKAYGWMSLANAQEYDGAEESMTILKKSLTPEQLVEAHKWAFDCFLSEYQDCN